MIIIKTEADDSDFDKIACYYFAARLGSGRPLTHTGKIPTTPMAGQFNGA